MTVTRAICTRIAMEYLYLEIEHLKKLQGMLKYDQMSNNQRIELERKVNELRKLIDIAKEIAFEK